MTLLVLMAFASSILVCHPKYKLLKVTMRKLIGYAFVFFLLMGCVSCTPAQIRFWKAVKAQNDAAVAHWVGVAECESNGNWQANTGNGHYGGLQFNLQTWRAYGGEGYPHQKSPGYQANIAERVRRGQGLGAWPHCGRFYR